MPPGLYTLSLHDALPISQVRQVERAGVVPPLPHVARGGEAGVEVGGVTADRKSTRLNSSHLGISDAAWALHSFPTRRSSDLTSAAGRAGRSSTAPATRGPRRRGGR